MKLCVALDQANDEECLKLASSLQGLELWLKIGLRAYLRTGPQLIEKVRKIDNFKIFLDLKIYDIPNTMADACEELAKLEVQMINLHASAGKKAMEYVMKRLNSLSNRPLVLGVSALTSFDEKHFQSVYHQNINQAVKTFSKMAYESGLDGMVCSVFESIMVKKCTNENFLTLTPGIRPFNEENNDQKRVANLNLAKENKSDFLVIGRPIYENPNPRELCEKILKNLNSF
ncbi:orotidine-5'-phosphate decarboxylase [Campylobacter sp. MIT 21-1685]|uniref:orotidine-5'-phosphate decarboxylase n=1 Tax=unclassified Campylobacter TaxID=2593542 RepID=UPI00224A6C17|nr:MULTISPECIES: orotidine-5'-phosphate decarboxylase [unclassified Campylobacter]MCX2683259.1 orotidine-5'-phosphate decarboxylase [Campylobacter sp. MIT 21-1684]MCX2751548.1 orotidine-5'-phosphate decarboxylase [Campylobacter sp. MIT 21-1682]MCX2807747.1 orotidine-5'-phosphate decarboxylase [Campylobacter sp. MIT 21-1685]